MFLNGLPFFVTKSRGLNCSLLNISLAGPLLNPFAKHCKTHLPPIGGFQVHTCLMDMEFKKLTDLVDDVVVNATAAREHVGDIEREIRTMRDRSRSTTSELPYSHCMPDPFIVYLIKFIVMWLNAFASDSGASNIYSPREIVT
ncbi:LOW QUALITY PROTEIN: hypothetical protein ACHAXN_004296, partial [Cyclotella atomus]